MKKDISPNFIQHSAIFIDTYINILPIRCNISNMALVLMLCLSSYSYSSGQSLDNVTWQLKKEQDGAKAYSGKLADSKYLAFRVEGQMNGHITTIPAILQDSDLFDEIFMDVNESKVTHSEADSLLHFYLNINAPWPAKNRAAVFTNLYDYDPVKNQLIIWSGSTDRGYPNKRSAIQLTECFGHWSFTQIDDDTIDVYYQFHANAGGYVPAWIINTKTIDAPLYTFQKIKEYLSDKRYQNKSFSFFGK